MGAGERCAGRDVKLTAQGKVKLTATARARATRRGHHHSVWRPRRRAQEKSRRARRPRMAAASAAPPPCGRRGAACSACRLSRRIRARKPSMGAGERCAGRDAARHSHRVGLRVGQDAPDSQASRRSLPEAPPCRGRCTRLRWGAAQLSSSSKGRGSSTGGEGVGGNQVGTRGEAGRQRLAAMLTAGGGRADSGASSAWRIGGAPVTRHRAPRPLPSCGGGTASAL